MGKWEIIMPLCKNCQKQYKRPHRSRATLCELCWFKAIKTRKGRKPLNKGIKLRNIPFPDG